MRNSASTGRAGTAALMVATLTLAAFILTACNTTAGIGKDASAAGQAVTKEADKIKEKM